jgi:hypothetical protein
MRSQIGDIILSRFFFFYLYIYNNKPRFQQVILQISRHIIFNSNLIPHRNNAIVLVINKINMSSLSNPKMSQKISDFNDMQNSTC